MRFSFICTPAQVKGMERVVVYGDGRIVSRRKTPAGIIFEVEKT